jgi:hypothetical protein
MQEFIVALIVACAAFAVLKRYLPKTWKLALRARAAGLAKKAGWLGLAQKLESASSAAAASSCSDGCSSCDGCGTPAPEEAGRKQIFLRKI